MQQCERLRSLLIGAIRLSIRVITGGDCEQQLALLWSLLVSVKGTLNQSRELRLSIRVITGGDYERDWLGKVPSSPMGWDSIKPSVLTAFDISHQRTRLLFSRYQFDEKPSILHATRLQSHSYEQLRFHLLIDGGQFDGKALILPTLCGRPLLRLHRNIDGNLFVSSIPFER